MGNVSNKVNIQVHFGENSMKSLHLFLRLNAVKMVLQVILLILASLVTSGYEATSKVSWQENRGIPFPFVTISYYSGPCLYQIYCQQAKIIYLSMCAIIGNVIVWYFVSCVIVLGYDVLKKYLSRNLLRM